MNVSACVVCGGTSIELLSSAIGERAYCRACFHGWRTKITAFNYVSTAMCSLGSSAERLQEQIAFFGPSAPDRARILEIGCATGELAEAVIERLRPASYEAVEISPAGLQAARHLDKLHVQPLPEVLEHGGIEPGFDLILISHVLEHLLDPAAQLRAMVSVLNPQGTVFVEVPNISGNPRLPIDDNRSHLHFFTTASLSKMLANAGLNVIAIETGAFLDARYADALRVIAKPFELPQWDSGLLTSHPLLVNEGPIVVWGAGSLAYEILGNFFAPSRIDFFIDADPSKQGSTLLGRDVRRPEDLGSEPRTVLVNSCDFAPSITADIKARYPNVPHRLIYIADLM
jgi:SAM-dependent methyltransferase